MCCGLHCVFVCVFMYVHVYVYMRMLMVMYAFARIDVVRCIGSQSPGGSTVMAIWLVPTGNYE